MNKNLPVEIWDMIGVERRKAFKRRVEEFEGQFEFSVGWKNYVLYTMNRKVKAFILYYNSEGVAFDFSFSHKAGITAYRFSRGDCVMNRGPWLTLPYVVSVYKSYKVYYKISRMAIRRISALIRKMDFRIRGIKPGARTVAQGGRG